MRINCLLCGNVGDVVGSLNADGVPISESVECPYCGYNTTSKTDLERARQRIPDAQIFDPLALPSTTPAEDVIKKRIEWVNLDPDPVFKASKDFITSTLQKAPRDVEQLERLIATFMEEERREKDWRIQRNLQFERKLLYWVKAVLQKFPR